MPTGQKLNPTLTVALANVLSIKCAHAKATKVRHLVAEWQDGGFAQIGIDAPPLLPGRPDHPRLCPAREVPRRRITKASSGRIALVHAIAHIELNAIDLALDMACRYAAYRLPRDFYTDWLSVADDEARHFLMLCDRLKDMGAGYGDLPAHDGLWQAALKTKDDFLGRLAIAPLVLEARGLDVTPPMIKRLQSVDDQKTAAAFSIIMNDEIGHVAIGKKWFDYVCGMERRDPVSTWHHLVGTYFGGPLKPPFNIAARTAAKFSSAFYAPMVNRTDLYDRPAKNEDQ